jgi:Na+/H+-dicarboxylate symporter
MKNKMLVQVVAAIVLAVIAGLMTGSSSEIFGVTYVQIFGLIGQLFLNALMLVVVPLVSASIITGTARMGAEQSIGTLGVKAFGFFLLTTFLAILVGLACALVFEPGSFHDQNAAIASVKEAGHMTEINAQSQADAFQKVEQILLRVVPSNILAAASQGQMMGIIGFCLLFGFFIPKIDPQAGSIMLGFWKGVFEIMMSITHLVMKALPIGVFGLVAKVVAAAGLESIQNAAWFFVTILAGLSIFTFVVLPLLLKFVAKVSPLAHFKAMLPALCTAFSTSSSAATLPISFECLEKGAGVSNRISSFSLPLGISLNLSGSAMHVCVAVIFIAQVYGIPLNAITIIITTIMTLITSLGMAGIPSASLISIVIVLHTLGIPADAIGMIMAVERILDMCRTVVNVFSNSCCAVLLASSEGEKNILVDTSVAEAA